MLISENSFFHWTMANPWQPIVDGSLIRVYCVYFQKALRIHARISRFMFSFDKDQNMGSPYFHRSVQLHLVLKK